MSDELTTEQQSNSREARIERLRPFQFKPGQSGNPNGRKGGESLKEYAKRMLAAMDEDQRQDFLKGLPKDKIWEMAEGKAKQDIEHSGEVAAKIISIDE
ncbi:MAG: DUF5681 domain-containing protein [Nanoarchaeota archaeon]